MSKQSSKPEFLKRDFTSIRSKGIEKQQCLVF